MNAPDAVNVLCPYYLREQYQALICESVLYGSTSIKILFKDKSARKRYEKGICSTASWKRCPLAMICNAAYEKREK